MGICVKDKGCNVNTGLKDILNFLKKKRGFDFSGYSSSTVEQRIAQRMDNIKCPELIDYVSLLEKDPKEVDNLLNVLTIKVSRFFRDSLTFDLIGERILPAILHEKKNRDDRSLRIWSAGCSYGEEPFSVAILVKELTEKEGYSLDLNIFATDMDRAAIKKTQEGVYPFESVMDIRYRHLKRYFTQTSDSYILTPAIKKMVTFSFYDMLDSRSHVPPESIFGAFDMVLCRNLLIYYEPDYQEIIFEKVFRSICQKGYLVLGGTEVPPKGFQGYLRKINEFCHVYQKI